MAGQKFITLAGGTLTEVIAVQVGGGGSANLVPSLDGGGLLDSTMLPPAGKQARFYGGLAGQPTASQELFSIDMVGDEIFTSGLPDNLGAVAVAPTGSVTFDVRVNGSSVGSMNVASGATIATWVLASTYTAASGDILSFYAPSAVDPTMAGIRYTFVGTRS